MLIKRNTQYNIGDIVNALPNYTLTCTKAGTTSTDPITVQEGTIIDGTCEQTFSQVIGLSLVELHCRYRELSETIKTLPKRVRKKKLS